MRFEQNEDIKIDGLLQTIRLRINKIVSLVYPAQIILQKNIYKRAQTLVNILLVLLQV